MDTPKFSVITATYNRAWCIDRAIRSVLTQTVGDFEMVITDDGSTDDSQAVVRAIDDPRIRLLRLPENRGMYEAQRHSVEHARGKYLVFLDSDDELLPHALKRFAAHEHVLSSEVAMIHANFANSPGGRIRGRPERFSHRQVIHFRDALCSAFLGDFLRCVRRDLFDRVPFRLETKFVTDLLWYRFYRASSFYYLPEVLGVVHTEGSDRRTKARIRDAAAWAEGMKAFIAEFATDIERHCPRKMGFFLRILAAYQLAAGDRRAALASGTRALRYNRDWRTLALIAACSWPRAALDRFLLGRFLLRAGE